MNKTIS